MNPSTAELLEAVEKAPADQVVVLPNNANIIAVARTVDSQSAKTVEGVPTTAVCEGFAALLGYDPQSNARVNSKSMAEIAEGVGVGEVTRAVRSSTSSAGEVSAGDWVGLNRSGICSIADTAVAATTALLDEIIGQAHEILTVVVGDGVTDRDSRAVEEWIAEHRPSVETEILHGGQSHYPFLFGVE